MCNVKEMAHTQGCCEESRLAGYGRLVVTVLSAGCILFKMYPFAIAIGLIYIIPKAYASILEKKADMNLLMLIAVIGAVFIHQEFEGAMVVFLFSVAVLLESWCVSRARHAIEALIEMSPTEADVVGRGKCLVTAIQVGEVILVRPGEKIPMDGVVIEGESSVNQAPITGESMPLFKQVGDEVFSGTLNQEGVLEIRVTKEAGHSTLARLTRMVQEAEGKKAHIEQWVTRFAAIYTPLMIGLACMLALIPSLITGNSDEWIYKALVLLVISCPCALVIATPVTLVAGITSASRAGILIKGGKFLEIPAKLKVIAMDKTGTITKGLPEVTGIYPYSGHTDKELIAIAASLEQFSNHPLARAITEKGKLMGVPLQNIERSRLLSGLGVEGMLEGELFWIGSHRFMHERGEETKEIHQKALSLEDAGHSVVAVGNHTHVCGLLSVADTVRPEAKEAVAALKGLGIKVAMLTGDHEKTAEALAREVGIDCYFANLLPEDKMGHIENLMKQEGLIAMVGDGVNDAPAMALANLGIAMGVMGTDVAIETSDIALMTDDLLQIPRLVKHSSRVMRTLKTNIFFASIVKIGVFGLALFGEASLWMAIAADTGASLLVVFNGLRMLHLKK
ncbi:MAG: heavy metal translocating P-type ATPase [Simkaniaceae bacterium]|nr:heavy metal translocating P-type ATPase [Simkaniaceae bacterium]